MTLNPWASFPASKTSFGALGGIKQSLKTKCKHVEFRVPMKPMPSAMV